MTLRYTKPERLFLRTHPELTERWLQDRIAEDPSLLGLGDLVLKDRERIHPRAGRLDLLLQDADANRRFEVEIQLGPTDESHVIRTIEYWDVERKRYPQYEHSAVIVAEDITSRFLNVISLFNGFIPLVALQLNAFRVADQVSLVFTKVLDELQLGLVDEDEEVQEVTDRGYWEKRSPRATLSIADELFAHLKKLDEELELKYNKFYIGLAKNGATSNFVTFKPKREWMLLELRLDRSDEVDAQLATAGLDVMEYRWGRYRIRLTREDLEKNQPLLLALMDQARAVAGR